mgnify:CR=1
MNKIKKYESMFLRQDMRRAKYLGMIMKWPNEGNTRRRNRIKARRLLIKADCPKCQISLVNDELKHLKIKASKHYQVLDEYICRQCIFIMRGGLH